MTTFHPRILARDNANKFPLQRYGRRLSQVGKRDRFERVEGTVISVARDKRERERAGINKVSRHDLKR